MQSSFARLGAGLRGTTAIGLCLMIAGSSAVAQDLTWGLTADDFWNQTDLNWAVTGAPVTDPLVAFADGQSVAFAGDGSVAIAVTLDTADVITPGIQFDATGYTITQNSAGTPYAIQPNGGVLVLDLAADVTATIDAPIVSLATDTVTVEGTATSNLTLSGDNTGSAGTLVVNGGQVALSGGYGGDVSNAGAAASTTITSRVTGDVDVSDGTVDNTTGGTIQGDVTVSGTGALVASGGAFRTPDDSAIGTIDLTGGTAEIAADTDVNVTNTGGSVTVNDAVSLRGTVTNTGATSTLTNLGTITGLVENTGTVIAGGDFRNGITNAGGEVRVIARTEADVTNTGGDLTIIAGERLVGAIVNADAGSTTTVEGVVNGSITVTDGLVQNNGRLSGTLDVNGGQATNTGVVTDVVTVDQTGLPAAVLNDDGGTYNALVTNIDGTILADGTDFTAGVAQNGGSLTVTDTDLGTGVTNAGGTVSIAGSVAATTSGDITNTGGDLTIADGQTLDGTVSNAAAASDTLIDGQLDGDLAVTDGTVTVTGEVTGTTVINGGRVENSGILQGTVDLDQTGGPAAVLDDTDGTINGLVTNTDGTILADNTTFTAGVAQNGGTMTVTGADLGTGIANAGGSVTLDGATPATTAGDITNTGGDLTIADGQTLDGTVSNAAAASTTTNAGTVDGDVTVTAGLVENSGTVTGETAVDGGQFTNTGRLEDDVTVAAGALLDDEDGVINGEVTSTDGTIVADGTTFNRGVAQTGGTLTVTDADLGTGVNNTGGQVTVAGVAGAETVGDVRNFGGDLTVTAGQILTGDVTSSGAASDTVVAGTVAGTVDVTAGTLDVTGEVDGDVLVDRATVDVDGGRIRGVVTTEETTLTLQDARIDGGVDVVSGTVTVNDDSRGDIRNAGGDVTIAAGQTLTGDVLQAGGTTTNDGTISGTVTTTAGALTNSGTIDGAAVAAGGVLTNAVGADITGLTTLQDGGTLDATGGTFSGGLLVQGGTFALTGDFVGDLENDGEDLSFAVDQTIDGNVTNTDGTLAIAGALNGTLTVDDGAVTTAATTLVRDAATVNGGQLTADGTTFADGLVVNGGDTLLTGDVQVGDLTVADGALDIGPGAAVTADLTQTGGETALQGTLDGSVVQTGGEIDNSGTLTGGLTVTAGRFIQSDGGQVVGATTVETDGNLNLDGGDFTGQITNAGGSIQITGAATADITNTAGTLRARIDGDLDGTVVNAATIVGDGGSIGTVVNTGAILVQTGDLSFGTLTNAGTVTVDADRILQADTATILDGGTLQSDGGILSGAFVAEAGAVLAFNDATLQGSLTSATDFATTGDVRFEGDLTLVDESVLTVESGSLAVTDTFRIAEAARLFVTDTTALDTAETINDGVIEMTGRVTWDGLVENNGDLTITTATIPNAAPADTADGVTFLDAVNNTGLITATGVLGFAGGLENTGTVNLVNGSTDDLIVISGEGLSGDGVLQFDIDLSDAEGAADMIKMTDGAFVTGDIQLQFNVLGSGGQQAEDIVLIDLVGRDPGNFTISANEIVDPSGILTYSLTRNADGDVVIEDGLNPGIAGLAGNIVLTQSLIGSVINRPSSPFVTTLAYDDVDPCGVGVWGRGIGGRAKSSGDVTQDDSGQNFEGDISAYYTGIQLGGDFACFNGAFDGWDLAFGAIGGVNTGSTSQPVFAIDPTSPDNLSDLQTGSTDVDFTQVYAGVYATAVRGPLAFDLQYRLEGTNFSATNTGTGDLPGLGLDDTTFSSHATTLSGAASYLYAVPDSDLTLVPTAGFAITQVSTDPITFTDRGVVSIDDFDSQIGFVGGSLARSWFGDDGVSAYREFVSATVYNDFADGPRSTFSPIDESGDRGLTTENLGLYSEISVGLNYVRVLQEGEFGAVKQFSANARADMRLSPRLKSWGITAQARYQF